MFPKIQENHVNWIKGIVHTPCYYRLNRNCHFGELGFEVKELTRGNCRRIKERIQKK